MNGPALMLPDTDTAFNTPARPRSFVTAAYDYPTDLFKNQTDGAQAGMADRFGQQMRRWQSGTSSTCTPWTAGQVVATFRRHNLATPAFTFF